MTILALEFSPYERSMAAVVDGQVRAFAIDQTAQGTRSFELIHRVLEQANISSADVECLAVGLGPGSYAGTRVAIAIAQGWQLARGTKLLGVPSADAIARKINTAEGIELAGQRIPFHGVVNIVFDAQREEAYAIRHQIGIDNSLAIGGFELLTSNEEEHRRKTGEIFVKADIGPWNLGKELVILSDARTIGQMAEQRADFVSGCQLEPIYLRKAEFMKTARTKLTV